MSKILHRIDISEGTLTLFSSLANFENKDIMEDFRNSENPSVAYYYSKYTEYLDNNLAIKNAISSMRLITLEIYDNCLRLEFTDNESRYLVKFICGQPEDPNVPR